MKNQSLKFLQKSKKHLLETWMSNQMEDQALREDLMSNDELRNQSDELLTALLKTLNSDNIDNTQSKDFEQVSGILSDISVSRARHGFSPRETAQFVLSLKQALTQTLEKEYTDDPKVLLDSYIAINKLIDSLNIITFETFIKGREEVIIRQTDEMNEISTPVIRVWEGVVALPIIGTLDSMRTQIVMENLLQEIVNTGSTIAILDISGVPAVDSLVAQHLLKTVSATRLMGAECIISGIRPEIAQTIVHLGIDLSHIKTKASLASALKLAFSMLNVEVKRVEKNRQNNG
ncbi:STAS domain-containing protein [Rhodocytophaga aerolata]|uniref:STAS domain-containing protein n=1 Tax=Rhodocytophaga aerolata TaxID=455078 RepID=A0ABT8R0F8_9BACT|nr:STAS domain-containing protein [Rhodocytophaga aerolata]MDO1445563.1 STAS domain-containing protein [Rhodocytophaga aerolata]